MLSAETAEDEDCIAYTECHSWGTLTSGMLLDTMNIIDDHMRPDYTVRF